MPSPHHSVFTGRILFLMLNEQLQSTMNFIVLWSCSFRLYEHTHTHTHRFMALDSVWDNPGEPVPEETFTHLHPLWSSIIPYLLHPGTTSKCCELMNMCVCSLFGMWFKYMMCTCVGHWLMVCKHSIHSLDSLCVIRVVLQPFSSWDRL